jgi:Na+-transporting NADH:ubiquinone oxidoreductase subunit NqrC
MLPQRLNRLLFDYKINLFQQRLDQGTCSKHKCIVARERAQHLCFYATADLDVRTHRVKAVYLKQKHDKKDEAGELPILGLMFWGPLVSYVSKCPLSPVKWILRNGTLSE